MINVLTYPDSTPTSEHHRVRVAVGPSLSSHVAEIQAALGDGYEVSNCEHARRRG